MNCTHHKEGIFSSSIFHSPGTARMKSQLLYIQYVNPDTHTARWLAQTSSTVGLESVAMFGSFGLSAVWCFTVWKSHLALQRESKVLLLGFLMDFSSYNLNQWLWRYAHFKMEIPLQRFLSF